MDIQLIIESDVLRGIVTSMLLAVVGGLFIVIIQSAREGITLWLYKYFRKNGGKLYVMAVSRNGSYLDVLGLFGLLGGFPIFVVLLFMTIGVLGNVFSGLVVNTKNVPMDLCVDNQCFSTGIGQNLLQEYPNITNAPSSNLTQLGSMNNFILQDLNNTIISGLPWSGPTTRVVSAANVPPAAYKIPLDRLERTVEYSGIYDNIMVSMRGMRLEFVNGSYAYMTLGVKNIYNTSTIEYDGWVMWDNPRLNDTIAGDLLSKNIRLTTDTRAGINLLLGSSVSDRLGTAQDIIDSMNYVSNNDTAHIKRATYYGIIIHNSWLGALNMTLKSRNQRDIRQLEISTYESVKNIQRVNSDKLFNVTLRNLDDNIKVLSNHSRELQRALHNGAYEYSSRVNNGDLTSYIAMCFIMAVSETRPFGMVRGYEPADIMTPIISINLMLAIPLLATAVAFLIPYIFVSIKLYINDDKWILYKLHVDTREYIINLCYSRFVVDKPMDNDKALKIMHEDYGDNGPIFGIGDKSDDMDKQKLCSTTF